MTSVRTITFPEISSFASGQKACCKCGKIISKQFKKYQTISPWNQKTPAEIRIENDKELEKLVPEWEAEKEECAACKKKYKPNIDLEFLTKEEWNETQDLRDEIIALNAKARKLGDLLDEKIAGKCIKVKYKKQERIGLITSCSGGSVSCDIVRSDLKGFTNDSYYLQVERIFE